MPNPAFDPDEIFLDSANLPAFHIEQFEGSLERPLPKATFYFLGMACLIIGLLFVSRLADLQLIRGKALAARSASNTLRHLPLFAERGLIYDRFDVELAWNEQSGRRYLVKPGLAHLVGYISYPLAAELADGQYDPKEFVGRSGAEAAFNQILQGKKGVKIEERDVRGELHSEYLLQKPVGGQDLRLSVDARLQERFHLAIADLIARGLFQAGVGVIMDIDTGELLALVSVPEYDANVLASGADNELLQNYVNDQRKPFLNRAVAGLYMPGSVVKPFLAIAALNEGIITPEKKILSTGSITVPNPFFPDRPSVFKDWKAHGWVDLREAVAVSSNVYFYSIGGGFGEQKGLGIEAIEKYVRWFGFGRLTGIELANEKAGVVPSPEWKAAVFGGEDWRLGDTYHTVIGQYGFQVTPLQLVRAMAAIANGGRLVRPTILAATDTPLAAEAEQLPIKPEHFQVIREGLRLAVTTGTARGLDLPTVKIAAKTGTAEVGVSKERINSLVIGFFPYERPRYAFAVVMEDGRQGQLVGALFVMRQIFEWMSLVTPEYLAYNGGN